MNALVRRGVGSKKENKRASTKKTTGLRGSEREGGGGFAKSLIRPSSGEGPFGEEIGGGITEREKVNPDHPGKKKMIPAVRREAKRPNRKFVFGERTLVNA